MTSASRAPQCGQRGSDRGLLRRGGWGVLLFFEATQHAKGVGVDGAWRSPAAQGVPQLPVNRDVRRRGFQLLLEPGAHLVGAHAQAVDVRPGWTEELQGFLPRAQKWSWLDSRPQPAAAVEEVVALLHQHLAQALAQDLDRAVH